MIEIKTLTKKFGSFTALNGVSFEIPTGSIFGLVGSNGAGKSTLLRTLAGVYRPDGGNVFFEGSPPYEHTEIKSRLFFISDYPYFPPQSTLEDLKSLLRDFYPGWDDKTFDRLCAMFPINRKDKLKDMSKGMQRQAALIAALFTRPDYFLLDEIFDGLDPVVRQLLKKLIAGEVADRGMTVLIASHNLRELEDFCDTIALLHRGGVLLEKELDSLRLGIHRIQAVFLDMPELPKMKEKIDIVSWERSGSVLSFVARGELEEILGALEQFGPQFQEAVPLSLEEVFISEMEAAGYDINNIVG